jgi:hypothetical protein
MWCIRITNRIQKESVVNTGKGKRTIPRTTKARNKKAKETRYEDKTKKGKYTTRERQEQRRRKEKRETRQHSFVEASEENVKENFHRNPLL